MGIKFYPDKKLFKLDSATSTYVIKIYEKGFLLNLYYGAKIPDINLTDFHFREEYSSFSANDEDIGWGEFSKDVCPMEYSGFGAGDFRKAAVAIKNKDGNNCTDFRYVSHKIYSGKPKITAQPATYANSEDECETLEILTRDGTTGAEAALVYSVFEGHGAMTRSVRIKNASDFPMDIEKAYSASVSLNSMDFDMITLYGKHASERNLCRNPLRHGQSSISSARGSSSHHHNPFCALVRQGTTEEHGDAYGFNLVYSGSFDITCDVDYYESTRINIGINPDGFTWHLEAGEVFETPEAVMVYSAEGIGEMSRIFHRLYRSNLVRGKWKNEKRPLLINSWEAAYFKFDSDTLVSFAERAKEIGIEMLVMDDGWFGKRDYASCSLGDWYVHEGKLVGGLANLIERVNALGLKFGIWYEPEMVSPDSDLYRAHPDWCLQVPSREKSIARGQYVLDMSRADVVDNIFEQMKAVLGSHKIDYVKWDFNRNLTEAGSALLSYERGEEIFHRFVLGTYSLMERLLTEFPDLLLENCSGGGGRFDPAMLYYSPQIWASDNTDPIERVDIQFGTSMCYPASSMGAHVSMCQRTNIDTRANVALWGTFGYELNPWKLTDREVEAAKEQVKSYHKYYNLIHNGDLYRLACPWDNKYFAAWGMVSKDRSEALFTFVVTRYHFNPTRFIKLKGLDAGKYYRLESTGEVYSGALLMNAGLNLSKMPRETGESYMLYFTEAK